jgi:RecB family exonuclease
LLVREALADPGGGVLGSLPGHLDHLAGPVRTLGARLREAGDVLRQSGTAEDALWVLWSGGEWAQRLEAASAAGGAAGRAADRDLDAVVALFAVFARYGEQHGPGAGVGPLVADLAREQVRSTPADADADADRGSGRPGAVRLLTAHRSKGLEWDVVAVCHVQDGQWPDLRVRHTLLGAEQLDVPAAGGRRESLTRAEMLAEERRLFYVATTRARRRLVVTAVDGAEDDGERPSPLLAELGVAPVAVRSRPHRYPGTWAADGAAIASSASGGAGDNDRAAFGDETPSHRHWPFMPLTLPALVATLRRLCVEEDVSPALRRAAQVRLARLAAATDDAGRPLVPAAHPRSWWGLHEVTASEVPIMTPGAPIPLSGSSLMSLEACPLRWFLEHEAHAASPTSTAQGFGKVVHALADEVATGRTPADIEALDARLEIVWRHLDYDSSWRSEAQRDAAREALTRFLAWHSADRGRRVVASEVSFTTEIAVGEHVVRLRGFIDRVELDNEGRVHVVDFKTGRTLPSSREVATHPQLGSYQLAVRSGALDRVLPPDADADADGTLPQAGPRAVPGGAELVHLRLDAHGGSTGPRLPGEPPRPPEVQYQDALPSDADGTDWVGEMLQRAVNRITSERFPPTPGPSCAVCPFVRCCPAQREGDQVIT